jgi:hypothetical protein
MVRRDAASNAFHAEFTGGLWRANPCHGAFTFSRQASRSYRTAIQLVRQRPPLRGHLLGPAQRKGKDRVSRI